MIMLDIMPLMFPLRKPWMHPNVIFVVSNQEWGYEATFEELPTLLKIKFDSGVIDELLFVDLPHEYRFPSGIMVLEYGKVIHESVYTQLRVVCEGQLRILFTCDLKARPLPFQGPNSPVPGSLQNASSPHQQRNLPEQNEHLPEQHVIQWPLQESTNSSGGVQQQSPEDVVSGAAGTSSLRACGSMLGFGYDTSTSQIMRATVSRMFLLPKQMTTVLRNLHFRRPVDFHRQLVETAVVNGDL
ncbi:uncharacterized protein LOC143856249 [Tasmannia lanceolata]|uniref:uncharacterized protein LOC143856249 n=1 Tax=Tasmannia lanceolata TaxID=3420 RepID=UPI0040637520